MKHKLKIAFSDMWGFKDRLPTGGTLSYEFNPNDNYFTDLLKMHFDVTVDHANPDLLIYSCFGTNYRNYNCKKMFFSGENRSFGKGHIPHYDDADVTLSHYSEESKEVFMPLWVLFVNWFKKPQPRPLPSNPTYCVDLDLIQNNRERFLSERKFCCFLNNNEIEDRINLFLSLDDREHVDSHGKLLNNVGHTLRGSQQDKVNLVSAYKFNIAFENSYHHGYNTEKIIEPLEVGCIPLYKGGERAKEYFNTDSFLYMNDFADMEDYVDKVFEIHNNSELYEHMILSKPLRTDKIEQDLSPKVILNQILEKINL